MTNEEILWELKRAEAEMVEREVAKFGKRHPWRKFQGLDIGDSYELGYLHATAVAIQMLEGFDPNWVRTDAVRRPILSAKGEIT